MKDLTKRVIVAFFGIPLLISATYMGGWYFYSIIIIVSTVSLWEFYTIQKNKNIFPQRITGLIAGLIILTGVQTGAWHLTGLLVLIFMMLILATEMFRSHKTVSANIGVTILGIIYIPLFLAAFLYLRSYVDNLFPGVSQAGFKFIMMIFISIWICDTFAYGFGRMIGKHKLYEKVSPNKTMEGGIAGIVGSLLVLGLVKQMNVLPLSWMQAAGIGLLTGVVGQAGDLVESWFKRDAGVKDSSNLLPGHGGMLDRFDSIIFVSPAMLVLVDLLL